MRQRGKFNFHLENGIHSKAQSIKLIGKHQMIDTGNFSLDVANKSGEANCSRLLLFAYFPSRRRSARFSIFKANFSGALSSPSSCSMFKMENCILFDESRVFLQWISEAFLVWKTEKNPFRQFQQRNELVFFNVCFRWFVSFHSRKNWKEKELERSFWAFCIAKCFSEKLQSL